MRLGLLAAVAVATLAGCTSSAVAGRGSDAASSKPPVSASSPPSTSSAPSISNAPPTTEAPSGPPAPSSSAAPRTLCASEETPQTIAPCLRDTLAAFCRGELNQAISEPVYVDAKTAQVPSECRPAIEATPAFTCRTNLSLYINKGLLDTIHSQIPANDLFYALAAVQAHEIGHVLQYTLHQPQIEVANPTDKQLQYIEQQADCLSGVWASRAVGGFDRPRFRKVAVELETSVSTNPEILTHGTPTERAAAIDRGLASAGRPQACQLVTFS